MELFVFTFAIGIMAFIYVDALPLRKSLREPQKVQIDQANMDQQPPAVKFNMNGQQPQAAVASLGQNPLKSNDNGNSINNNIVNNFVAPAGGRGGSNLQLVPAGTVTVAAQNRLLAGGYGAGAGAPPGGLGTPGVFRAGGPPGGLRLGARGPVGGLGLAPAQVNPKLVGGVQQLGAQVQRPASDGTKPDNVVVAQQVGGGDGMMPAGGAPGRTGTKIELRAPPLPNAGERINQQLPQPAGRGDINNAPRLAKVPLHREQQIEQPHIEDENDKHPIKKAMFLDNHQLLKVNDLKPPNHLDAVRLEQDGHLNHDYKKEIFLGNHEDIEQGTDQQVKDKLGDIFHKVDTNTDGFITSLELETWIVTKVEEHFDEAVKENEHVFQALDTDKDGDITWREFHIQFLMAKGHDQKRAEQHMEDYETIPLDPEDKEQLIRFKFRWAEADEDPQDNKLMLTEFRNFRHPEQSENMLTRMVMDIIENLDKDHNGILTEEEFAALPPGEVDEQWKESDRMWQDERKKEFKEVMDLNKDGQVTKDELKHYVDPKNPQHSKLESQNLIELADTNKDGKVSLEEMLENTELFLGSKVVNTGRSFHDEF